MISKTERSMLRKTGAAGKERTSGASPVRTCDESTIVVTTGIVHYTRMATASVFVATATETGDLWTEEGQCGVPAQVSIVTVHTNDVPCRRAKMITSLLASARPST